MQDTTTQGNIRQDKTIEETTRQYEFDNTRQIYIIQYKTIEGNAQSYTTR